MECSAPRYLHQREITVPCGKCAFCLATRRSDWVQRLMQEWRVSKGSAFITLTYANPKLTWRSGKPQLVKEDLRNWFKKLRKAYFKRKPKEWCKANRIRYYAVGEYGSETYRPHYHVILFGDVSEEIIRKTWDKGQVHIGKLTLASCGYCTKYVINSKEAAMREGRTPPFQVMSRKPGIGNAYLTPEMIAWHKADRRNYMDVQGDKRHLPRYYKEKIFSKIDRVRIANRAVRDSIDRERKLLYQIWKKSKGKIKNAQAYRDRQLKELAMRIRDKSKQNKLTNDVI